MNKKKGHRLVTFVIAALSLLLLSGCIALEKAEPPSGMAGEEIRIATGTQGLVGNMSIGLGETGKEDYIDVSGKNQHGLVAGLFLRLAGDPPIEERMGVYAGETVEFEGYVLFVKEISKGNTGGHITLLIQNKAIIVWDVYKDTKKVLVVKNEPGPVTSTAVGREVPSSTFLTARALDAFEEDNLQKILSNSDNFEEFIFLLEASGYRLEAGKW